MQPGNCFLLLLCGAFTLPLLAQPRVIWQIGKPDHSPLEFKSPATGPQRFELGKNDWKADWQARQGLNNPQTLVFRLPAKTGTYHLKVALLIERPRIPTLQVAINGHIGIFYVHPKLSYEKADFAYAFDPHESESTLDIVLPSGYLKAGENELILSAVDDPPVTPGAGDSSALMYDAIALENESSAEKNSRDFQADVIPTIFFHKKAGALTEVVDCFIRALGARLEGDVALSLGGKKYGAKLPEGFEFGEQLVSLDIPAWTGTADGNLEVGASKRAAVKVAMKAARQWKVYVVPHTHLDVGFTDYQGKVAETQARVLSQAADLIREHPEFRFSMDGSWNLEQVLLTRSPEVKKGILDLIRTDKMGMPVQYCNLLTGYASLETLYRSLYASKDLANKYKLPFEYANITDVPTYSGAYPSVLASSGVKYWVAAANNDRAPIFNHKQWNEQSPFWWEGPDGGKVLFWYSRHYMHVQTLFGLPPELPAVRESLPVYLQAFSRPGYKPDAALIYGTQVENTDLFPTTATFATDWNSKYEYPKLQYSTFPDFFHYLDQNYGKDLSTFKGDGGPYWEDGIGSDAYFAAEDRRNQNRALSAEVLSSVTHSIDHNLNPPEGAFTEIWRNIILFAEHTWLSYNSVSQPDHEESIRQGRVKDSRAEIAALKIEDVTGRSLSQLADQIHVPANTLVVFNSLNWKRDAMVETDLLENVSLEDLSTHAAVPLQILEHKEKFLHVRFLAEDLPSAGYKCYAIKYGKTPTPQVPVKQETTIENSFYRLEVDTATGALRSIFDKQLSRELVDSKSPYKFGQYVYVTGGDGATKMINPFSTLPEGKLQEHGAANGKVAGVQHLPWGDSVRLTSTDTNTPTIETEVLLFKKAKKIEFRYRIVKGYTNAKEGVYIAFPVAASEPHFDYSTQQGWIDPSRDLMKGGSLEWFSIQYWMASHDDQVSVGIIPVDAPLASFGDIFRGKWPGTFEPKSSTLFSYVMNNYWHTNYRAGQGGEFRFRYVMTSDSKTDGGALTHLGMENLRPAEVDYVVGQDKAGNPDRPLPAEGKGFLKIDASNIALITWKAAEDGNGSILRLAEIAGKQTQASIEFPSAQLLSAQLCSGVEDPGKAVPLETEYVVKLSMKPFEVVSLRIRQK